MAGIVAGNNGINSSGGGSSGGGGGCNDEDIGGYSDGRGNRQQSTKSGRERNGGRDGDDKATMTTMARTMMAAMVTVVMAVFLPNRQQSAKRGSRRNGSGDGYSNGNGNC